jgi:5-methylcytosine-specific restriction endonuclease McrA
MVLKDGITYSYTENVLSNILGAKDEMASYWLKIDDNHITDGSVCWLYRYALNGGSHRKKARIPSRKLFDSIFDFDFNEFKIYVIEKGNLQPSKTTKDESWWAANTSRRYSRTFIFENDFIILNDETQCYEDTLTSSAMEGGKKQVYSTKYERNPKLREAAIKKHGLTCKVCDFNFEKNYGAYGKGLIHVHHLNPISDSGPTVTSVDDDMTTLCPNCHAMIHHRKNKTLKIEELKQMIDKARSLM